jgi:nucleotide-binding universal stress UspA family protein
MTRSGRETSQKKYRFRSILVPHDFTTVSDLALAHAVELATVEEGTLHLLHVVQLVAGVPSIDGALQLTASLQAFAARRHAERRLVELGSGVGLPVATRVEMGAPSSVICAVADRIGADLIVMGARVRSGAMRLFRDSTAARTVRNSRCPVFVLPSYAPGPAPESPS